MPRPDGDGSDTLLVVALLATVAAELSLWSLLQLVGLIAGR